MFIRLTNAETMKDFLVNLNCVREIIPVCCENQCTLVYPNGERVTVMGTLPDIKDKIAGLR